MVYLDNAATTRNKPFIVRYTLMKETLLSANPGRAGHKAAMRAGIKTERTRAVIREKFFDGDVIFTKNCTEALNLAVNAKIKGKKVVTTYAEHNSVLRPLKYLSEQNKIDLKIIDPTVEAFEKNITSETAMVVLGAVSNVTGEKREVERIFEVVKRRSNALTVLDCAQSAGKMDFSYQNVDMLASSGHKSLYGVQGTGFLLVKHGVRLRPLIYGGTGSSGFEIDLPQDIPEGMEAGTINAPGIIALGRAIEYVFANRERIVRKEEHLAKRLFALINKIDNVEIYSCQNGILLCNLRGVSSGELADTLSDKYGICVRGGLHCAPLMHKKLGTIPGGAVRMSFGRGNGLRQVYYTYFALKRICKDRNQKKESRI